MQYLFSIIIPVYNVEKYLEICFDSFYINESFFEVILIDDGSTDSSGAICDLIASGKENVKVVHKKNEGLGFARNSGLKYASGEYVIFIDSDDFWCNKHALTDLKNIVIDTKVDIYVFKDVFFDEINQVFVQNLKIPPKNKSNIYYLKKGYYRVTAWNKVIRREFLIENNILFEKGVSEDFIWNLKILSHSPRIYYFLEYDLYGYRKNRFNSITNVYKENYLNEWMAILNFAKENYVGKNIEYKYFSSYIYFNLFMTISKLDIAREDRDLLKENLQECRCLVSKSANIKIKVLKALITFFGVNNTLCFLKKVNSR